MKNKTYAFEVQIENEVKYYTVVTNNLERAWIMLSKLVWKDNSDNQELEGYQAKLIRRKH